MIKRIGKESAAPRVLIKDAAFPSPFGSTLEYSSPARGTWNIVHIGMLVPEAHQIFVCAQGCLRGVVLTAAEMGASHRFSTIAIRQNNLLDGDMEQLIIDGVTDILNKLPVLPPAVLVYTSCIHHFMACDLDFVYSTLRTRFPCVKFADCYMNPIMRKSGTTPDELMRNRLYSFLEPQEKDSKTLCIVGNNFALRPQNELFEMLHANGFRLLEIQSFKTFEGYLSLSKAAFSITQNLAAVNSAKALENRLGIKHIHFTSSFDYEEILEDYRLLCDTLNIKLPDFSDRIKLCEDKLSNLKDRIGDTPIAIDYTAFSRPLSLALLLVKHGFNVKRIYLDSFTREEKNDLDKLQRLSPSIEIFPTVNPMMRVTLRNSSDFLCIGQKAAYFCNSTHFVNIVENGGLYGFDGIAALCDEISKAHTNEKNTRDLIEIKGMGCGCCL